jgi:hypothetical protein
MNVNATVKIFSFGERWNFPFNDVTACIQAAVLLRTNYVFTLAAAAIVIEWPWSFSVFVFFWLSQVCLSIAASWAQDFAI